MEQKRRRKHDRFHISEKKKKLKQDLIGGKKFSGGGK